MKNYFSLLKIFTINLFRRNSGQKKGGIIALLLALGYVYIIIGINLITAIAKTAPLCYEYGLFNEYMTFIMFGVFFIILFFGASSIISQLYFGKDSELLSSLPVSSMTVFMAKLSIIYIFELAISLLLMIPCTIVAGIVTSMAPMFYIIMFFSAFLLPILPLTLASVLALPLMYLVSFFRSRGTFASIAYIILFLIVFVVYYLGFMRINRVANSDNVISGNFNTLLTTISKICYPFLALVRGATMSVVFFDSVVLSAIINIAIYIFTVALSLFICIIISKFIYYKGVSAQLESNSVHSKKRTGKRQKINAPLTAYIKKELKTLMRTPSFAYQCIIGVIMCPILLYFTTFLFSLDSDINSVISESNIRFFSGIFEIMLLSTINIGSCGCFTIEGEHFAINKILPVPYKLIVKAKFILYSIIGVISGFISSLVLAIISKMFLHTFLFFIFFVLFELAIVSISMLLDLKNPRLNWITPNEAFKQNRTVLTCQLLNSTLGIIMTFIMVLLYFVFQFALGIWGGLLTFPIMYAIGTLLFILFFKALMDNVDPYFKRIEI